MTTYRAPLVGMKFHAPALAVLQCLPAGAPLELVPEPENPFDPNAIVVRVRADAVPVGQHEKLSLLLAGYGYTLDDFMGPQPGAGGDLDLQWASWHLGHVKANNQQDPTMSCAAELAPKLAGPTFAMLAFDTDGRPIVEVLL